MAGVFLPSGYVMTFTASAVKAGNYTLVGSDDSYTVVAAGATSTIGPFNNPRQYQVNYLSHSQEPSGVYTAADDAALQNQIDAKAPVHVTANIGVPEDAVVVTEYGDEYQHTTVMVVDTVLPAITGGVEQGLGVLLYTLPAGAVVIDKAYMDISITQTEDNITADTPEVGIGTVVASGEVAVLSGTAAFENIITGQVAADCDGTPTTKTVVDQVLVVEEADGPIPIYLNVADDWAAEGDAEAAVTGTVVIHWQFMNEVGM